MFGWEFPPFNSGGLGTACYGITKSLSEKGVEIDFVLPRSYKFSEKLPKIKIKEINSPLVSYATSQNYRRRVFLLKKNGPNNIYCDNLIQEVYRYSLLAREIAKNACCDVIHTHDWMTFPAGIEAQKILNKPFLTHIHSTETDRSGGHGINPEVSKIETDGIKKSDRVIAVSNFTKDKIVKNYNTDRDKIDVIYNAIDKNEFSSDLDCENHFNFHGKKVVLFLGRITLHKGPDYFLYVAKKVLEKNKDVIFIVSGSGDMDRQIIEQAADLGIADKVLFTGFLRGEQLKKIYKMANLYVMPSVAEPFGITPLESLASKTPVLISKQSGISEILNHCLKVDFWDVDEMANKILAVLENEELEECLVDNGFSEIDEFNWGSVADKIIGIYERMIWKKKCCN